MAAIELDHYSNNTRAWLVQHLAGARYRFRVATGFFSVAGYDLIRSHLGHLKVDILVGYDEHSHERLKAKLIDDIMAHLSRWDTDNRRLAVISLVGKLERRELQVHEQLETRIRARDHAKMYLIDDRLALNGSANLTRNGLIHNAESVSAVIEPGRVGWLSARFEEYWTAPDTQDLTQSLLNALQRWLELRSPYDVYLKTVNALVPEDQSAPPRASYKKPTEYQQVVIERSLRQLRQWRGSFIVASTGLGKTIMATHIAFRMHREGIVLNALIFAPKPIRKEWSEAFRIAGVSAQDFTRNNLDQMVRGKRADGEIRQIEDALSQVDERTLIILDETQYFVNRLRASEKSESTRSSKRLMAADRRSFERLMRVVNGQNPYIVLLTATPLVKDVNDLNTQLLLLPHVAPSDQPDQLGRHRIRFPGDESAGKPWTVETRGDHFNAFMELPVVTVISTSYVAKTYAVHTELGDYVEFPEEIRWIPKIEIHRVRVPLPFESAIAEALDAKLFRHVLVRFMSRGTWQRSETTIENLVTVSWASSPAELARTLRRVLNEYEAKVSFKFDHAHRESILKPIIDALDQLPVERDLKLMRLRDIVEDSVREGRKVIVYSERLATCLYLEQSLRVLLPEVRIGNVVQINRKGELDLKEDYDVDQMIVTTPPAKAGGFSGYA